MNKFKVNLIIGKNDKFFLGLYKSSDYYGFKLIPFYKDDITYAYKSLFSLIEYKNKKLYKLFVSENKDLHELGKKLILKEIYNEQVY